MARVFVSDVLNIIKIEELSERTEPFYITDISTEQSERGRKANKDDAMGEQYVFRVVNENGEVVGRCKTATLQLMGQIDEMLRHGTPTDEYGPLLIQFVGEKNTRRFIGVQPSTPPSPNGK